MQVGPAVGKHYAAGDSQAVPKTPPATLHYLRATYDDHFELVWQFVAHRGVAEDAREAVVQAIFHLVRRQLSVKQHATPTRSWVARVARSVVRAHLRQRAGLAALATPFEAEPLSGQLAVFESLEGKSATEQLQLIFDGMTDVQREAFILCEMEGFSEQETCEALGLEESALASCLVVAVRVFNIGAAELRAQRFWLSREQEPP
jgi:DNA-directed RNA polymerase specialized sigma24 family protein